MATKSSLEQNNGSKAVSRRHRARTNWMPIALIAMLVVTIFLVIPFTSETEIHIQIGYSDNIQNVWVDTPTKPLISYLFPLSYSLGAYTLNVTIGMMGQNLNFSRANVPVGEYVVIWQRGVPAQGYYTIVVQLYKQEIPKDSYTISVSF